MKKIIKTKKNVSKIQPKYENYKKVNFYVENGETPISCGCGGDEDPDTFILTLDSSPALSRRIVKTISKEFEIIDEMYENVFLMDRNNKTNLQITKSIKKLGLNFDKKLAPLQMEKDE